MCCPKTTPGSFHNDRHTGLKADFILANPPFGNLNWSGEHLAQDQRWHYGMPPKRNTNFAWIQHIVHHLTPGGIGGCVLPNGSMSSHQRQEKAIRTNLIEADLVDCMVALPGQLFHSTQMPVCLWLLARRRRHRGEILFIDARQLGRMVERTHRELTEDDIARIAGTYHAWAPQPTPIATVPNPLNSTLGVRGHRIARQLFRPGFAQDERQVPVAVSTSLF